MEKFATHGCCFGVLFLWFLFMQKLVTKETKKKNLLCKVGLPDDASFSGGKIRKSVLECLFPFGILNGRPDGKQLTLSDGNL